MTFTQRGLCLEKDTQEAGIECLPENSTLEQDPGAGPKDRRARGPDFGELNRFSGKAVLCFCSLHPAETFKHRQGSIWAREAPQVCHFYIWPCGPSLVPLGLLFLLAKEKAGLPDLQGVFSTLQVHDLDSRGRCRVSSGVRREIPSTRWRKVVGSPGPTECRAPCKAPGTT